MVILGGDYAPFRTGPSGKYLGKLEVYSWKGLWDSRLPGFHVEMLFPPPVFLQL
jgi:hypothetical protein